MRLAASLMTSGLSLSRGADGAAACRWRSALGADAFEEDGRGLVGRVLVDEAALEGPLEDGLAEAGEA